MTTTNFARSRRTLDAVCAVTILVGVLVGSYGLLVVPQSLPGGAWIAAIGLSLVIAGALATDWIGTHTGLSVPARRRLSFVFAALAVVLLVSFVAVNGATFESGERFGNN